ncbi:MAG TPA: TonB-dependent receptor [Thiobacillaceae bacterium]|nr:TonB-dependent receptor [Thiobacillaceae bacterium]HNA80955.1 TonB-dependent receptor [Thiobacillaceae bacterium]HNF88226.1 TonB-dependent receptor [Thiobacillaceae bacterium]HNH88778.1 TonB-dependent receptor [Thiobacillaceae bacterium]HNI07890.1 TonB-dependent receptor [Thiobacillaceae bacterium]
MRPGTLVPILAALDCILTAPCQAESVLPTEAEYFLEQPIVLSVSRLAQPLDEAPAAVTVIDREMIQASGFRQIPDLLRLVPGFQVLWRRGNIAAVTYHGLTSLYSRRMQVLVDGRSVYNPAYGQVHWRGLPLAVEDIERIEVVRGPNAATDGANAFQGTINIVTRHAAEDQGWSFGVTAGDQSVRDGLLRVSGHGEDFHVRATLNARRDDWVDSQRDAARDYLFSLRGDYRPTARDEMTGELGAGVGDWENSSVGYTFSPTQNTDFRDWYGQFRWRRVLDTENEWAVNVNHTYTRGDESFPAPLGLTAPDNLDYWFERSALELTRLGRLGDDLRLSWAAEVRQDKAWSRVLTGSDRVLSGNLYRLSGTAEWAFTRDWLLHAGAMLERHYYAGTRLSPRLALTWEAAPNQSLRAGVSRAYRSPTFLEQNSDFKLELGAVNYDQLLLSPYKLKPERITAWELGYVARSRSGRIQGDARLFLNQVKDLIDFGTPFPVPGEVVGDGADLTYQNLYHARQRGVEFQVRWRPEASSWLTWSQSWSDTESNSPEYAASDPHATTSLLVSHALGDGWTSSLGYYHQGKMTWVGSGAPTPAYDRLDLRLARTWKQPGGRWEAALVAQNLLGAYSEYGTSTLVDRRYFATLRVDFH